MCWTAGRSPMGPSAANSSVSGRRRPQARAEHHGRRDAHSRYISIPAAPPPTTERLRGPRTRCAPRRGFLQRDLLQLRRRGPVGVGRALRVFADEEHRVGGEGGCLRFADERDRTCQGTGLRSVVHADRSRGRAAVAAGRSVRASDRARRRRNSSPGRRGGAASRRSRPGARTSAPATDASEPPP